MFFKDESEIENVILEELNKLQSIQEMSIMKQEKILKLCYLGLALLSVSVIVSCSIAVRLFFV